jgi:hypothetical protein
MAFTVSILRQPLYGLVYWNGKSFDYTPNVGFSGSDSFVYSEITDGSEKIFTKYVNSFNTPPVAVSTTLTAAPYIASVIDINSVVVDSTNPFNYLVFTEVSASLNNPITTDGRKIYYTANTPSSLDVITYTATDKQFTITGNISVNVLSAAKGAEYSYSSLEKIYQVKDITNFYHTNSSGWTGSYYVYATYGTSWDSIDLGAYEGFADQVVNSVQPWDVIYDNKNIYYSVHTTLCGNSGRWYDDEISGNYYYGIINPKALSWDLLYSILNSNSAKWNNSISTYNILSANLNYTKPLFDSVYNTVTSSSAEIWDSSELNEWSASNSTKLRNVFTYTSANSAKWIPPVSGYQSLSAGMATVVGYIKNTSSTVYANSATLWDNSNLNSLSAAYYDKWTLANTELSANKNRFDIFSASVNSISSQIDVTNNNSNLLLTTISSNSAVIWDNYETENYFSSNSSNWNNLNSNLIAYSGIWNNPNNIGNIINNNSPSFNLFLNLVSANSSNAWSNLESDYNLILANSANLNLIYNILTSNSSTWNAGNNISNIIASYSAVFDTTYNTVLANSASTWATYSNTLLSSNSANWNSVYVTLSNNSYLWSSGGNIGNVIANISSVFDTLYNTVSANSANTWAIYSNTILSSNSANWNNVYVTLSNNSYLWSSGGNIGNIIGNISSVFDSTYNIVSTNSASTWATYSNTLLSSNSANWNSLYDTLSTNSYLWSSGGNIGSVIANVSSVFDTLYNTVSTNSASTWATYSNTLLSSNSANWNSLYDTLSTNSYLWSSGGNIGNTIGNVSSVFDSTYNIVSANSADKWSNTDTTLLSSNSANWISIYNLMTAYSSTWNSGNAISAIIIDGKNKYDSTYNLLTSNSSTNWIGETIYQSISNNIGSFNQLKSIFTNLDSDTLWINSGIIYDQLYNNINSYSANFISNTTSVQNNSTFWDTTYVDAALSGISADLISNYNTLTASTAYWIFAEEDNLKNTFSYVASNSAKLNSEYDQLTSISGNWDSSYNNYIVPALSSQYLSGSPTASISSRNLLIYGNLVISQNLSALGSKTSINTSNYTLTAFEVTNDSSIDCFVITKSSNLTNIVTFSSVNSGPVLWVKSNNTVSINTTLGNQALNVVGDISASGTITNYLGAQTSLLQSNSSKYESAYNFTTANSANLDLVKLSKSNYDDTFNYYSLSSSGINKLVNDNPIYNSVYINISSNYNRNDSINNFVTYSASNINRDTVLRSLTGQYDSTYTLLSSICSTQITSLNYLFSFNKVVSSDKVKMLIPYNLKIVSWNVFADTPTNLSIDVLSGYTFNKTTYTRSITNNYPITGTDITKSSADNLDSLGWITNISQGGINPSFIQFNLTRNDSASSVMVNLKAYRI